MARSGAAPRSSFAQLPIVGPVYALYLGVDGRAERVINFYPPASLSEGK